MPYFSTDTVSVQRPRDALPGGPHGQERRGRRLHGRPAHGPSATKLDHLTYTDALVNDLGVMDATALSLCRDNDVRMRVFGMSEPGNVTRALVGENIGTLVTTD